MEKCELHAAVQLPSAAGGVLADWSVQSNLIAFVMQPPPAADGSSAAAAVAVIESSNPQEHTRLELPQRANQSDSNRGGCYGDELINVAWSPPHCAWMLLTAVRGGWLTLWSTSRHDDSSAGRSLVHAHVINEWFVNEVVDVGEEVVAAVWLRTCVMWSWPPRARLGSAAARGLEAPFYDSSRMVGNTMHWVRPGLLCIAVITASCRLQFCWQVAASSSVAQRWRQSAAIVLPSIAGRVLCADVCCAVDGSVRIAVVASNNPSRLVVFSLRDSPLTPAGNDAPVVGVQILCEFEFPVADQASITQVLLPCCDNARTAYITVRDASGLRYRLLRFEIAAEPSPTYMTVDAEPPAAVGTVLKPTASRIVQLPSDLGGDGTARPALTMTMSADGSLMCVTHRYKGGALEVRNPRTLECIETLSTATFAAHAIAGPVCFSPNSCVMLAGVHWTLRSMAVPDGSRHLQQAKAPGGTGDTHYASYGVEAVGGSMTHDIVMNDDVMDGDVMHHNNWLAMWVMSPDCVSAAGGGMAAAALQDDVVVLDAAAVMSDDDVAAFGMLCAQKLAWCLVHDHVPWDLTRFLVALQKRMVPDAGQQLVEHCMDGIDKALHTHSFWQQTAYSTRLDRVKINVLMSARHVESPRVIADLMMRCQFDMLNQLLNVAFIKDIRAAVHTAQQQQQAGGSARSPDYSKLAFIELEGWVEWCWQCCYFWLQCCMLWMHQSAQQQQQPSSVPSVPPDAIPVIRLLGDSKGWMQKKWMTTLQYIGMIGRGLAIHLKRAAAAAASDDDAAAADSDAAPQPPPTEKLPHRLADLPKGLLALHALLDIQSLTSATYKVLLDHKAQATASDKDSKQRDIEVALAMTEDVRRTFSGRLKLHYARANVPMSAAAMRDTWRAAAASNPATKLVITKIPVCSVEDIFENARFLGLIPTRKDEGSTHSMLLEATLYRLPTPPSFRKLMRDCLPSSRHAVLPQPSPQPPSFADEQGTATDTTAAKVAAWRRERHAACVVAQPPPPGMAAAGQQLPHDVITATPLDAWEWESVDGLSCTNQLDTELLNDHTAAKLPQLRRAILYRTPFSSSP